ncbi:transposase domain containing protein [Trichonephila clavipes]|nr:transposase domain containing protein [Trichonephila clavipes]
MLGRRIAASQPPPTILPELRRALLDEWCNIPQDQIDNLILSMPRRCYLLNYGRIRKRCLPGEQCTVGHTQAGVGSIMFWRMFSWAFLGPVVVVEQTMNATGYLNIIADQLHPYMSSVIPARYGMFQQDNTPCHKAKMVLEWL